jgi:hypothetical protein
MFDPGNLTPGVTINFPEDSGIFLIRRASLGEQIMPSAPASKALDARSIAKFSREPF